MVWEKWIGMKVYIVLKNHRTFQGVVINIDESKVGDESLIWITIEDKYGKSIVFCNTEIDMMQEED